ncbi:hypothetical protein OR573_09840 [Halomonas sp. CH40]
MRLQAEVEQHLEAIACRLHQSKGWVINQALSEYIERQQREQKRWQQKLAVCRIMSIAYSDGAHLPPFCVATGLLQQYGTIRCYLKRQ